MSLMSTFSKSSYRASTIAGAIKSLYALTPSEANDFLETLERKERYYRDAIPTGEENLEISEMQRVYHKVINPMSTLGENEKMYLPPIVDAKLGIVGNQDLFEAVLASDSGLSKGQTALELGSGRGRITCHVASLTGAHVTGLNIVEDQLENARKFARAYGLSDQCDFVEHNFNVFPFPFPDDSFDAVYNVGAITGLATDLDAVLREADRLLKPGGVFLSLDIFSLSDFDTSNFRQNALVTEAMGVNGAWYLRRPEDVTDTLTSLGFEILINKDPANFSLLEPLAKTLRRHRRMGKLCELLGYVKLLPAHVGAIISRLVHSFEACCLEAERQKLFTYTYYIVAKKVER